MTETLKPASGRDWRKLRETHSITVLPSSGMVVEIGRAHLDQLLLAGKIPDTLTPIVAEVLWVSAGNGRAHNELEAEKAFLELLNAVTTAALVNPRVVPNPTEEDELSIDDIEFSDKLTIYRIATQPLAVLHRFRQKQEADVDAVPEGDDLQPATERDPTPG